MGFSPCGNDQLYYKEEREKLKRKVKTYKLACFLQFYKRIVQNIDGHCPFLYLIHCCFNNMLDQYFFLCFSMFIWTSSCSLASFLNLCAIYYHHCLMLFGSFYSVSFFERIKPRVSAWMLCNISSFVTMMER